LEEENAKLNLPVAGQALVLLLLREADPEG
jgi:hypothetical protein